MKHKLFIALLSVSAITVASPLQEKLRVVASKITEIKENIKSGAYLIRSDCNTRCTMSCRSCNSLLK